MYNNKILALAFAKLTYLIDEAWKEAKNTECNPLVIIPLG